VTPKKTAKARIIEAARRLPDDTTVEALAEVEKAKAMWLASARDLGKPIPAPLYRPASYRIAL